MGLYCFRAGLPGGWHACQACRMLSREHELIQSAWVMSELELATRLHLRWCIGKRAWVVSEPELANHLHWRWRACKRACVHVQSPAAG